MRTVKKNQNLKPFLHFPLQILKKKNPWGNSVIYTYFSLTFFVAQVSEDAMKEKNEIIGRLEDKTNQINATMKQLEQRYSPIFDFLHSRLHHYILPHSYTVATEM